MKKNYQKMAGGIILFSLACLFLPPFSQKETFKEHPISCSTPQQACVFKTLFGLETFDTAAVIHNRELVESSLKKGLVWMANAQLDNGGWGAGTHSHQDVRDPHAVAADPATTALVGMALLRNGNTLTKGKYAENLKKGLDFLLEAVENTPEQNKYITNLKGTQPQTKLGQNIDVILTMQFFTNILSKIDKKDCSCIDRIEDALNKCVRKTQQAQDVDGGIRDGGWAPVLQSALANNALESAKDVGAKVDDKVLEKSREYQKSNFDVKTNSAVTGKAAGVMLYSVSGSARASAKEARSADSAVAKAKKEGKLKADAPVTEQNLVVAGMSSTQAKKYETAYNVRKAATIRAQDGDVVDGFGSNGGEEYLSYLMTGESLIIGNDNSWKNWFEKMAGRMVQIQSNDGSWQGHHCITSPVFCTATCLLILSIDKDIDFLVKVKN
jgi:hypothetical protein